MNKNKLNLPKALTIMLSTAFIFASTAVVIFGYLTFQAIWGQPLNPVVAAAEIEPDVVIEIDPDDPMPVPTMLVGLPTPTAVAAAAAQQNSERVNVLVMGIDRRPGEPFISRTDSMMIMSIDPANNTASILSVPRDLYVVLPGRDRDRINTAFVYGSTGNNPAGGAALAMQTVEYNLGISIDHYLLVDFSAVMGGIDTLGGIDVNVPFTINDPTYPNMYYGYDPLYIPAGLQHFDGITALKYARTRHQDSDFGRAKRQQQVVLAVREKALSLGIGDLLQRSPVLYQQLQEGIRTDMSLEQLVALATAASEIPAENIQNEALDQRFVSGHTTAQGAQVLVLNNALVAPLIQAMFYE